MNDYKKGDKIGTPGFVRGLHDMHEKEGKMDEKKILNYVFIHARFFTIFTIVGKCSAATT
jgi:gamma-glutamyltranspeptidase